MSYSRWSHSYWYTYWQASNKESVDTAAFCICRFEGNITFTAEQLTDDMIGCLAEVRKKTKMPLRKIY